MPQNPTQAEQTGKPQTALTPAHGQGPTFCAGCLPEKSSSGTEPALSGVETASKAGLTTSKQAELPARNIPGKRFLISPSAATISNACPLKNSSLVRSHSRRRAQEWDGQAMPAWVVYLKDADDISQFPRPPGSDTLVLRYEDIRVQKTVKSSVLRQMNMDKANCRDPLNPA